VSADLDLLTGGVAELVAELCFPAVRRLLIVLVGLARGGESERRLVQRLRQNGKSEHRSTQDAEAAHKRRGVRLNEHIALENSEATLDCSRPPACFSSLAHGGGRGAAPRTPSPTVCKRDSRATSEQQAASEQAQALTLSSLGSWIAPLTVGSGAPPPPTAPPAAAVVAVRAQRQTSTIAARGNQYAT